jgi:transposase
MKKTNKSKKQTTIGLDLGDRNHTYCVLDPAGKIDKEGAIANTRGNLEAMAKSYPGARVIMEAGMHSPWVSRFLKGQEMEVIVANPRKVRAIYQNERKSDRRDALMLARIGRMDPALLCPIEHGSEEAQRDLVRIKLRDALVHSRVSLINSVRFTLKSLGHAVSNPSSGRFHKTVLAEVPEHLRAMIAPSIQVLEALTLQIKILDVEISRMARESYPETLLLQQVGGVGPITSLYFVLKVGDPWRFERARDVGAFVGLCPRRDQSGECDKELRITKCGDRYLRRLLVSAAQYILGPFGAECALRTQGLQLAGDGTRRSKKRAVVAVARKLAVLLLTLWRKQATYEPFHAMA